MAFLKVSRLLDLEMFPNTLGKGMFNACPLMESPNVVVISDLAAGSSKLAC